jgi:hypothetical protein
MGKPNRVTPFATIEALPGRGLFMGNRGGALHPRTGEHRIVRPFATRAWITCVLDWKPGVRAPQWIPGRYTPLFFLDEATAFAAGHRPCALCRRGAYLRFRDAWVAAGLVAAGAAAPRAAEMDARLHAERGEGRGAARRQRLHDAPAKSLPDGVMVTLDSRAWLLAGGQLWRWADGGYDGTRPHPSGSLRVLTPAATVAVLRAGYRPEIHPSAHGA